MQLHTVKLFPGSSKCPFENCYSNSNVLSRTAVTLSHYFFVLAKLMEDLKYEDKENLKVGGEKKKRGGGGGGRKEKGRGKKQ